MAKASLKVRIPDDVFIGLFDRAANDLGRHDSREAHFSLPEPLAPGGPFSNVLITFEGRGFTYKGGHLNGGTINKVIYEDQDGIDFAVYTGLNVNAAKLKTSDVFLGFQDIFLKGNDLVNGSREADILYGGAGDDQIKGFNGNDVIAGGRGNDTLTGDLGDDTFNFQLSSGGIGNDVVTDFEAGLVLAAGVVQDLLAVDELPDLTKIKQVGADTVIDLGDGFSVTLLNVLATDITADDFQFPM